MQVDILCQNYYDEYGGDPYEARVYFDKEVNSPKEAFDFIIESCEKLDEYDPIYGYFFEIYVDHNQVGSYTKATRIEDESQLTLDPKFLVL